MSNSMRSVPHSQTGQALSMTPTYTESIDGKVVLALFDHRLASGDEVGGQEGISVAYRSANFEKSVTAITDALLKYLAINSYSTTNAAYDFVRERVEMMVSDDTDELIHRAALSASAIEHVFGMDHLSTDFVHFSDVPGSTGAERAS